MSNEKVDETKCNWEIEMEKKGEKDEFPDFGNEFAIKSGIAYGVAFALFIPCFLGKNTCFMINSVFLWIPAIVYMICNWLAYFHDPSRYVEKYKCLFGYIRCTHFSLLTGSFAFLFDMWTFYSLMGVTMTDSPLRLFAILPMAILGMTAIIYSYMKGKIIDENDDIDEFKPPKQPDPIGNKFNFIERNGRVVLYAIIMFCGVIMALQTVFSDVYSTEKTGIGMKILTYIGLILGLMADLIAFKFQVEYRPKDYCLPDKFK